VDAAFRTTKLKAWQGCFPQCEKLCTNTGGTGSRSAAPTLGSDYRGMTIIV
jgi:hypothetical protein